MASGVSNSAGRERRGRALAGILLLTTALGGLVAPTAALGQTAGQEAGRSFNIPAQALGEALTDFGQQSGLQVSVDAAAIRGVSSPGVTGTMPSAQALSRLLTGTGFTFRINGNVVTLEKAPQTADGAIQLGPVRVEGAGAPVSGVRYDPTVTERSGSYTAPAMRTATGLPMSIRETPQSVTVITAQLMEDKRIEDVIDIVEQTTGLSINRYESNRGSMYSRGFKIENYLIDGVWTSIDEQWSAGEILNSTAIYDHIEVLRGSDGLMIGTGNPSAVINMVRKRADSDVLTGSLSAEAGSWSQYGFSVDINTPITANKHTRIRLVADYDRSGSYVDRLKNRQYTLFGTIEQDIGTRTLLTAGISHQDNHADSPTWGGVLAWTLDSNDAVIRLDRGRNLNPAPDWTYWDSRYTTAFARAEHDFGGGWKAKATYTHGERESESRIALLYPYPIDPESGQSVMALAPGMKFPFPGYAGTYWVQNDKDDINLRLDGGFDLLGRRHELIFGYDRSEEKFVADGAAMNPTLAGTPSFFDFDGKAPDPGYGTRGNFKDHKITQSAFYAAGRFALLEPLKLIAGARLIDYDVVDNKAPANNYASNDRFLPYAGLVLSPFGNVSIYASYTSIFLPQNNLDADNKILPPVEGNTYEGGIKAEFFGGRLNAALSIFRMEQSNVAKSNGLVPIDPANPTGPKRTAWIAVDGVVSKGFEAEVAGEVLPGWNVTAGYSQFKARQPSGADINSLIPREQFNLFTTYKLPGALQGLTIGGGVRWQSEVWVHQVLAQALGVPKLQQDAYLVADALARYQFNDRLSLQLNVNNIFDKKYAAPTDDGMQVYWQAPRNAQLKIKYQF